MLRRPGARLSIDGRELTMPEAAAVALVVETTVSGLHDRATLVLGPLSPWLDVSPSAPAELALEALGDDAELVLTGSVGRVRHQPWGTVVDMLASTAALDRVRIGRAYASQSVGDIVRDLLSEAGVDAGDIDDGPTLGAYHVDERRTVWRHVRVLAALLGAELATGAAGEVHVRKPRSGRADHTLRAGAELLSWMAGTRELPLASAEVGPFGAASEQGTDAWSLVHHQPGGGGLHRLLPAIRDREAAAAIDAATAAAHARSAVSPASPPRGRRRCAPATSSRSRASTAASATLRVLRSRHQIDGHGFRTALELEAA